MNHAIHAQMLDTGFEPIGTLVGSVFVKGAELLMDAQGELLAGMEAMMTERIRRQREVLDVSNRSIQKLCGCRNFFDLVLAQHEWFFDCLNWTASEIRAVGNDAAAMTRKATECLTEVVRERSEDPHKASAASAVIRKNDHLQQAAE